MVELIRKLTSNYDEQEYRDWLWSNDIDFKEENEINYPKDRHEYVEVKAPDDTYIFINRKLYKRVDLILELTGNENFKDMDIMLDEIACRTGYSKEMLTEIFYEAVEEGDSYKDAFYHVACVSHEMDW